MARFFGLSKTPVFGWIDAGLISARKCGNRFRLRSDQVQVVLEAATRLAHYIPKRPRPFHKLRKMRRKVHLPEQDGFTLGEIARLFGCSSTTIGRAVGCCMLEAKPRTPHRWIVRKRSLLKNPLFGRLIWQPAPKAATRTVRLPLKELFATWEVASILGVSQQTVRNLIGEGELVAIRIGSKKLFVKRDSLKEFLKRRRTVSQSVITSVT